MEDELKSHTVVGVGGGVGGVRQGGQIKSSEHQCVDISTLQNGHLMVGKASINHKTPLTYDECVFILSRKTVLCCLVLHLTW